MDLPVLLTPGEDGFIVAQCPIIPGCVSQGRSKDEALANIKEAIELSLDSEQDEGWSFPDHFELVSITVGKKL